MKKGSFELGSKTRIVSNAAPTTMATINQRPMRTNSLSVALGLMNFLYKSNVINVEAELSIESTLERIAPINPAATSPTKPGTASGATTSRSNIGKAVSPSSVTPGMVCLNK